MKNYLVTIPIAGHVTFTLKATSYSEAKEAALMKEIGLSSDSSKVDFEYETLEKFDEGNVSLCPCPSEILLSCNDCGNELDKDSETCQCEKK